MEHVPEGSLGIHLCCGLRNGGILDQEWTRHVLCSRCDASEDETCTYRWNHAEPECTVDEAGLPQPVSNDRRGLLRVWSLRCISCATAGCKAVRF